MKVRASLDAGGRWGLVVFLAIAAAAFGSFRLLGVGSADSARPAAAVFVPLAEYAERAPHVSSLLNITGVQGEVRGQSVLPAPDQPPVRAASFATPTARYLGYSVAQLTIMQPEIAALRAALSEGARTVAQADWVKAWTQYLHLGGVYLQGRVAALNQAIDGNAGGLAGGTANPHFTGLHRIEFGLWSGQAPQSLVRYADTLSADVARMRALLPRTVISPLALATRTHEILEDAVRDLLSGADVPWSGEGVAGTAAGVVATRELISVLRPLLKEPAALQADPPANPRTPAVVDADLHVVQSELDALAGAYGGQLPTDRQLTKMQAERLDGDVGQALEGLAQLPGMLETTGPAPTPAIPRAGVKVDP
jgi:high-affinity iron transporter